MGFGACGRVPEQQTASLYCCWRSSERHEHPLWDGVGCASVASHVLPAAAVAAAWVLVCAAAAACLCLLLLDRCGLFARARFMLLFAYREGNQSTFRLPSG
jgi:hypothetical protein